MHIKSIIFQYSSIWVYMTVFKAKKEGKVDSKCIYIQIWPVFTLKGCIQRPKAPIQDQKTCQTPQ